MNYRQPFRGEYPISQKYGEVIPGVTYLGKPHTGIDYACPTGTEILASADGIIMKAGWDGTGYGNCVIILHEAKHATLYAHLSKITVYLNQKVQQGDVIGYSGNTGNSTGPHLHFEFRSVWDNYTTHKDPMTLPMMSVDDSIADTELPAEPIELIGADAFQSGDLLKVQNTLGVKAFYGQQFGDYTVYPQGTPFYYTGENTVRASNGLTYLRVVPATFTVWVAVHDDDTQLLDKENA